MTRNDIIGGVLIFLLVGLVIGLSTLAHSLRTPTQVDEVTLCPEGEPVAHTVIVVDRTDPWTAEHHALFRKAVARALDELPTHGRLSFFTIDGEVPVVPAPLFELCKPAEGGEANPLYENRRMVQRYYEKHFGTSLEALVDSLSQPEEATYSPIMETIRVVAELPAFAEFSGKRKLVIVSDFLQNMPTCSHYWTLPDIRQFRKSAHTREAKLSLTGIDVRIVYLLRKTKTVYQTPAHRNYWIEYLVSRGAASVHSGE